MSIFNFLIILNVILKYKEIFNTENFMKNAILINLKLIFNNFKYIITKHKCQFQKKKDFK